MSRSSQDFAGNIERFSGFADVYDRYRPSPPAVLASILTQLIGTVPARVVDLGCGTGLSSRYWADKAQEVIGIEPSADMRHEAEAQTDAANVSYRAGYSHQTGLPDHCASIVTCSQSLHWMEPQATFEEARRLLRPGGIFAAYDYDWPPTVGAWEAEAAYLACSARVQECTRTLSSPPSLRRWSKDGHLDRMRASGCFRYTKEIAVHHADTGNAERLVGLLLNQGSVMTLLKNGFSEAEIGIEDLRATAYQSMEAEERTWYWSSRVRLGAI